MGTISTNLAGYMDPSPAYSSGGGGYSIPNGYGYGGTSYGSTTSPSVPAVQRSFPTSSFGQTIPVIWGKARVPGSYIWAPEIVYQPARNQYYVDKYKLSGRIRFARPLVSNSRWKLRRLWSDGKLLVNNATGVRKVNYSFYDGHSSQGRDPHMVDKEGSANVSAHRGYLDIVIRDYTLPEGSTQPPYWEAELVQDDTGSIDIDVTTGFFSNPVNTYAAVDYDNGRWFGITSSPAYVRMFSVGSNIELYAVPLTGYYDGIEENSLRYIAEMDRLIGVDFQPGPGGGAYPCVINPETGQVVAHSDEMGAAGQFTNTLCVVPFPGGGVLIAVSFNSGVVSTHRFTAETILRVLISASAWDGRGDVECLVVGATRASDADVYAVAGDTLYKIVVNSTGAFLSITEVYSDADDLVYCVFHDGDVIVWNDNLEVMRIEPSDGSVVWTKTVPYQIPTTASSRDLAPPEAHRLDGDIMVEQATSYNFTDLDDGETTIVAKSNATVGRQVYDGQSRYVINTDRGGEIARKQTFDAAGDGTTRDLEDFISAVWEGTGFSSSEHDELNIDDTVKGAVIDITSGSREIIRSIAEPYSFAIFERDGKIITKRALTDGDFAVDATISTTDIVDNGGQAIRARRLNPEEFIARYGINYRDPDEIYQPRPQWGEIPSLPLPVAPTDIGVKANIPIIVDGDTIKVLATEKVNRLAIQKHEFNLRLKAKYADLEPEDIIQFSFAGRTVTARVFETTLNTDFTITVTATEFLPSVAVTISAGVGNPTIPVPPGTALSKYYHLDIPLLTDTDDTAGDSLVQYHVLASGGQPYWDGATLYRKESSTYLAQAVQTENGLVGLALTALPDWDIPYVTEFTREITVAIISGDTDLLVSATYQEVCEGANMFAIGQPGRWEVCHVIDITDNGDGSYTFTGLRRGRGTSEEFTGDHEVGDFVVWLGDNVQRLEYAVDALNDAFDFKPVGFGASLSNTIAVNRTITGEAEKIPKPAQLDAVIDGSDIDLSWIRRSRIGSYWADDGEDTYETPLGESLEQYVIRIKDGPAGTVLRTVTVDDAEAYTYTAANITTDFGSMPADLTWDIRQVSGTGVVCPTREVTITL